MKNLLCPDAEKRDIEEIYKGIGRVAVHWAFLESALEALIGLLRVLHPTDGRKPPRNLSDKIRYIREVTKRQAALEYHRHTLFELMEQIDILSSTRHAMIHGVVHGRTFREGLKLSRVRIGEQATEWEAKAETFSYQEVLVFSLVVLELVDSVLLLNSKLVEEAAAAGRISPISN